MVQRRTAALCCCVLALLAGCALPAQARKHALFSRHRKQALQAAPVLSTPADVLFSPLYAPSLTNLTYALNVTGLLPLMKNATLFTNTTVLFPTDDAVAYLLTAFNVSLQAFASDTRLLSTLLQYHIATIGRVLTLSTSTAGTLYLEPDNQYISFVRTGGFVYIGDMAGGLSQIITPNIILSNTSVVHLVSNMLLPNIWGSLQSYLSTGLGNSIVGGLSSYTQFMMASPFISSLLDSNSTIAITVFAPNDAAVNGVVVNGSVDPSYLSGQGLDILLSAHMLIGAQFAESWANGTVLQTLHPTASILVMRDRGVLGMVLVGQGFLQGTASIVAADISGGASGSLLHVLDGMFLPSQPGPYNPPESSTEYSSPEDSIQ